MKKYDRKALKYKIHTRQKPNKPLVNDLNYNIRQLNEKNYLWDTSELLHHCHYHLMLQWEAEASSSLSGHPVRKECGLKNGVTKARHAEKGYKLQNIF